MIEKKSGWIELFDIIQNIYGRPLGDGVKSILMEEFTEPIKIKDKIIYQGRKSKCDDKKGCKGCMCK